MKATKFPGVYRLPDGRLLVRVTRQAEGRRTYRKKTLPQGTTLTEAVQIALEMQASGLTVKKLYARPSLTDYAERWIEANAERLKPSTASRYVDALSGWILPRLGTMHVDAIRRSHVAEWVTWAERKRKADGTAYAHATLAGIWRVLVQLIGDAVADLELDLDPTTRVPGPRRRGQARREKRTLTAPELASVLDEVRHGWPDLYTEVLALAHTGMRAGELYALRWQDVDLERGIATVRRSVWRGQEGETKTGDPREVPLSAVLVEELRGIRGFGLVFPDSDGRHRHYTTLHKPLKEAARRAGVSHVSPQVLRRTFNTLCLAEGIDRAVLRSMMGHVSEEMTQRYAGVGDELKRAAVVRLFGEG